MLERTLNQRGVIQNRARKQQIADMSGLRFNKITPTDLWAEIVEKQNRALALVVAAMCLGISIIVAAAIH